MADRRLKILVLSTFDGANANSIRDFLFSFRAHSRHDYYYVFDCRILDAETDFSPFDVILVFWSVYLLSPDLNEPVRERIRKTSALKTLFLQDEYRDVRPIGRVMSELGTQVVFTCVAEQDHETFYPRALIPTLEAVYTVLPGYVPAYLERVRMDDRMSRPLDIGYRSRVAPYYLGDLGQEKRIVAERFEAISREQGFRSDISVRERDRVYGRRWLDFLAASRCVLGSASGASVVDFSGDIRQNCERYLGLHPQATYEEVKQRFFADVDGKVIIDTVSPRIFEAAALRCTLVHLEGAYAGVLDSERHYIRVRRNYSNIRDVVEQIRDVAHCQRLADNTYRDLIGSGAYSYRAFAAEFDRRLAAHISSSVVRQPLSPLRFYATNFIRHGQAIVPYGDRFAVLPSTKLAHDLLRRGLEQLPRSRSGPAVSRLIQNPGDFFSKGWLSTRIALEVRPLRRLVRQYLWHRKVWGQVGYHELMNDLLKLDIIRRVRAGLLKARTPFGISVSFDQEAGVLTLSSEPNETETMASTPLPEELPVALRSGGVKAIVWDHSVLGLQIVYAPTGSKWVTVGLGAGGIHSFDALVQLLRLDPERISAILLPVLAGGARRQ